MSDLKVFGDDHASELFAAIRSLKPLLLEKAAQHEQSRRLDDEVVAKMTAAGLFRVAAPRRWGGMCLSASVMSQMAEEIAQACPATAWVFCISNSNSWVASMGPDSVQEAVFAEGVPIMCGAVNPPGTFKKVDGGFVVNGAWPYCSGSLHSSWGMFSMGGRDEHGHFIPGGTFFVPLSEVSVQDTWMTAGLKGSGSNTCVAKDLFVPSKQHVPPDQPAGVHPPGKKHMGEPSDYFPLMPHLRSVMVGVLVGTAQAMLERVAKAASTRGIVYTTYAKQSDSHVAQKEIGEAGALISAARVLMQHATRTIDTLALARTPIPYLDQCENKAHTSLAVDLLVKAADKLMYVAGSSAFMDSNALQRYWRDLGMAARHAAFAPQVGFEIYGRALMGVEPNIAPVAALI